MSSVLCVDLARANVIYLDTEFTDLLAPELLSLSTVSAAGGEHYVELDIESPSSASTLARASDFARHNSVLDQWGRVPGSESTYEQMGLRTARWLEDQSNRNGQPAYIAIDYPADYELLKYVLRDAGQWDALRPFVRPMNVAEISSRLDGALSAAAMYEAMRERGLERHHALADAHALRAAHLAIITGRQVQL